MGIYPPPKLGQLHRREMTLRVNRVISGAGSDVRFSPVSDRLLRCREMTRWAKSGHGGFNKGCPLIPRLAKADCRHDPISIGTPMTQWTCAMFCLPFRQARKQRYTSYVE